MFRKREYSLLSQFTFIIVILYILFIISFSSLFLFMNYNMQDRLYQSYHKTIAYCLSGLESDMTIVRRSMLSTLYDNQDLSQLSISRDPHSIALNETALSRTLISYQKCYSTVDGQFIYIKQNESFVSSASYDTSVFPPYLRGLLRNVNFPTYYRSLQSSSNQYTFHQVNGQYFLTRMFAYNQLICGIWVDMDTIVQKLLQSTNAETLCFFQDTSSPSVLISKYPFSPSELSELLCEDSQLITFQDKRYMKFHFTPEFYPDGLLILMPYSQIQQAMELHYALQGLFLLALSVGFLITFFLYRNRLQLPVYQLHRIAENVQKQVPLEEIRQLEVSRCKEIRLINDEAIHLLEHIDSLENQVLKEQLHKKEFELLSLRNQVSPHFLINCLSVISSMAGTSVSRSTLKSMISTLAGHLRYTLSSKPYVSLAEEIRFVHNYYALNSYRYPDSLTHETDIRGLCDNATVFPCLVLMLSENSIKHNLGTGEKLHLSITATEETSSEGTVFVHITHLDSGSGFPIHMLDELNRPDPNLNEIADGTRIGLYHIKKRLLLAYGASNVQIQFSNNPKTGGAQIDISLPYISYQEA